MPESQAASCDRREWLDCFLCPLVASNVGGIVPRLEKLALGGTYPEGLGVLRPDNQDRGLSEHRHPSVHFAKALSELLLKI